MYTALITLIKDHYIDMNEEKICFVIMPISDTQGYDAGHFDRVFDYLIKPAVIKAGFIPIRADKVQKTDLIMIGIIKQIITRICAYAI